MVSQDQSKLLKYSLIAIFIILALALLVYGIKSIRRFFGFEDNSREVTFSFTPYVDTGGNVTEDFPVESYLSELHNVLDTWLLDASPRCKAYKRLMDLNDNQFITVLNGFYDTYGESLRSRMNSTWQSGCSVFSKQWDDQVLERMARLNINA